MALVLLPGAAFAEDGDYNAKLITKPGKVITYKQMMSDIEALKEQYPGLVDYEFFGKTLAGLDIPVVKLGKGEKEILVVAAIHGREHITAVQAMYAIDNYAYYYAKGKKLRGMDLRKILDSVTYYIVPMANPDGVAIATSKANAKQKALAEKAVGKSFYRKMNKDSWKGNGRAANLNRNFPTNWADQEKSSRNRKDTDYKGKSGGSEPETQALMKLCMERQFACMLTNHTYGQVLYWRDIYTGRTPGDAGLRNAVAGATGYAIDWAHGYYYGGRFEQWFRSTFNRPAIVVEMMPPRYGAPKSYANFMSVCWAKTNTLILKAADCGKVTKNYRLYFDANKGGKLKNKPDYTRNVRTGKAIGSLPKPVRKGYSFTGWYTEKKGGTRYVAATVYEPQINTRLYAHWKKK